MMIKKPAIIGIITASRANHGLTQSRAVVAVGLNVTIVVSENSGKEKMRPLERFGLNS